MCRGAGPDGPGRTKEEKIMRTLTQSKLKHCSSLELSVLHDIVNRAMAARRPFSAKWLALAQAVEAIQTERRSRLERPWRNSA